MKIQKKSQSSSIGSFGSIVNVKVREILPDPKTCWSLVALLLAAWLTCHVGLHGHAQPSVLVGVHVLKQRA